MIHTVMGVVLDHVLVILIANGMIIMVYVDKEVRGILHSIIGTTGIAIIGVHGVGTIHLMVVPIIQEDMDVDGEDIIEDTVEDIEEVQQDVWDQEDQLCQGVAWVPEE